jgi:hypothetical protein
LRNIVDQGICGIFYTSKDCGSAGVNKVFAAAKMNGGLYVVVICDGQRKSAPHQ